jgi:hypothetical protein
MKEIRIAEIRAEKTTTGILSDKKENLHLAGMPIVYEQPTVIKDPAGSFTEIIKRGALDDADISDTRLLYNHDLNKVPLARTPKTMILTKGPAGLEMAAMLPDTEEARAVHTAVDRGDLNGMSFAFVVPPGGDKWDMRTKTREIFKIKKILEISVVPFPAYPQSSVEARTAVNASGETAKTRIAVNKLLMKGIN